MPPQPEREIRVAVDAWPDADLEIRATDEAGMTFHGYAAVFNRNSEPMPFTERIAPGAFSRSLKRERNIRMFLNHNDDMVLGSTKSGTMRLAEDEKGLRVEADLPDTTAGRDLATLLRRGDVDSMSFGFQAVRDKWSEDLNTRELLEVRLFEVSAVTGWPAYPATSAAMRHLAEELGEDEKPLDEAARALFSPEHLTPQQRDLLIRAINARTDVPFVAQTVKDWTARFAAKGYVA